ncbi:MAG: 3-oxoacyl-ACP reductase FabG [Bacteroidetes bacterium]|nr:3-oxoacyl-ACP reductase FabG [Bacteroidota bacterium]
MKNLQSRTAVVTGGSRGIGAAIARRLALQGANVAITYHNSEAKAQLVVKQIEETGARALAIAADGGDPKAIRRAIDEVMRVFGGLDILVNNAGIGLFNDISAFTDEDFDRIMAVNVRAVFAGSQAALPYLGAGGRIITVGSCLAERVARPGAALYAMSKSALVGLTKGMARDLGPRGITVNMVHPGPVDTDMNPADGPFSDDQRSRMAIPAYGKADDIAGLVAYLAGPESGYITGAGFVADGGTNI